MFQICLALNYKEIWFTCSTANPIYIVLTECKVPHPPGKKYFGSPLKFQILIFHTHTLNAYEYTLIVLTQPPALITSMARQLLHMYYIITLCH